MMERVNYYDYLGLNVGATENEIKQAISMKKKIMKQDGVELRDLTAVMLNEERKREELENFVRLLRQRREAQKASLINNPQVNPKQAAQALLEEFGVRAPAKEKAELTEVQEVPTEEVEQAVEEMAHEEDVTATEDENCFKAVDPFAGYMAKKSAVEVIVEEQKPEEDEPTQDVSAPVEEVVGEIVEQPIEEELSTEEVEEVAEETELDDFDEMDSEDDDDFMGETTQCICWNCKNLFEYDEYLENDCPVCGAGSSIRSFEVEVERIRRDLENGLPKKHLEDKVEKLRKKYGQEETYVATATLNELHKQVQSASDVYAIQEKINYSLATIQRLLSQKKVFSAQDEYKRMRETFEREGCHTAALIKELSQRVQECENLFSVAQRAVETGDKNTFFAAALRLQQQAIDCKALDGLVERCPVPGVQDLQFVYCDGRVTLRWNYELENASFFVLKKRQDGEYELLEDDILGKEYEFEDENHGEEIVYSVGACVAGYKTQELAVHCWLHLETVKFVQEGNVSGAVSLSWMPPAGAERVLVCKKEGGVPESWDDGELLTFAERTGFVDRKVERNRKYGYKIKCVYNTAHGEKESEEVSILCTPKFIFLPLSNVTSHTDLYAFRWVVNYDEIYVGKFVVFKSEKRVDISENDRYSIDDIELMGLTLCPAEVGKTSAEVPLINGDCAYYYVGTEEEGRVYLSSGIRVEACGNLHDVRMVNIGNLNKNIRILFSWGLYSSQILILDKEDGYAEEYEKSAVIGIQNKGGKEGEDSLILRDLPTKEYHFLSVFEKHAITGQYTLVKKLEILTANAQTIEYTSHVSKGKAKFALYFEDQYEIGDIYICKVGARNAMDIVAGPYEVQAKRKLFKGMCAEINYENANLDDGKYLLRFTDMNKRKISLINGKYYSVTLKEKEKNE